MRLKVIACKVLFREISVLAGKSNNIIDTTFLRQDFHDQPELLRKKLQDAIDRLDAGDDEYSHRCKYGVNSFDAILLAYGLCSNAVEKLVSKKYPLVIPRAHDCITLLLGSAKTYKHYFDDNPGTYWASIGWQENSILPGKERYQTMLEKYCELYGPENGEYLMEMEQSWLTKYNRFTYVDWPQFKEKDRSRQLKQEVKQAAEYLSWEYNELTGDSSLMTDFLEGNWDDERFLIVPPGKSITVVYSDDIFSDKEAGERNQ